MSSLPLILTTIAVLLVTAPSLRAGGPLTIAAFVAALVALVLELIVLARVA